VRKGVQGVEAETPKAPEVPKALSRDAERKGCPLPDRQGSVMSSPNKVRADPRPKTISVLSKGHRMLRVETFVVSVCLSVNLIV